MTSHIKILNAFIAYATSDADIRALAIGGSIVRGEANQWADIDMFPILTDMPSSSMASSLVDKWTKYLEEPIAICNRGGSKDGFGLGIQAVFAPFVKVDFNFNGFNNLCDHPVWKSREIIFDKDGLFSAFLKRQKEYWSEAEIAACIPEHLNSLQHAFWIEYTKAYKCLLNGNIWYSIVYINRLRDFIFSAFRIYHNKPALTFHPFKSIEEQLENIAVTSELWQTLPTYSLENVALTLYRCVNIFEKYTDHSSRLRDVVLQEMPVETLLEKAQPNP
jgi:hypothetical protein